MALLVDLVRVLVVLNVVLLLGLAYVWGRNYSQLRSKHALGLLLFAVFLLGENLLAAYYFIFDPILSEWIASAHHVPRPAQIAMAALRVLEFVGLVFLTWVTWD